MQWLVLALVFNSEQQAVYYCKANDVVDACIVNEQIVYTCRALVDKSLRYIVKQLNCV